MRDNLVDLEYLDRSHKNIDTYGEYHIGLERGWNTGFVLHRNGHRKSTLIIRMSTVLDCLSPQTWVYIGKFKTTMKAIKKRKKEILARVNTEYHTKFVHVVVE